MFSQRVNKGKNQKLKRNNYERLVNREIDPESGQFKPKLESNYPFPIDLVPNGIQFGAQSIRKE